MSKQLSHFFKRLESVCWLISSLKELARKLLEIIKVSEKLVTLLLQRKDLHLYLLTLVCDHIQEPLLKRKPGIRVPIKRVRADWKSLLDPYRLGHRFLLVNF